jgi:co-chaperonin GroES (HSP10)
MGLLASLVLTVSLAPLAVAAEEKAVAEVKTLTATVQAVDLETRTVKLKGPEGKEVTLQVSEEARNLPQVKVGDQVTMQYFEGLAVTLEQSTSPHRQRVETESTFRAEPGKKPGGMMVEKMQVYAKVQAIDPEQRTVTLRGPERQVTLKVAKDVDLGKVKVGDDVYAEYLEGFAISVQPPAGGKATLQ